MPFDGEISKMTPEGLKIVPRDIHFDLEETLATNWLGDEFLTYLFNAISFAFPEGERMFVEAVKACSKDITDETLLSQISNFTKQEHIHAREHRSYNLALCKARNYDHDILEDRFAKRIRWARKNVPPKMRLAATVCLEHLTAILAQLVLSRPEVFENAADDMRRLWYWHAIEESEHKGVAFDVYMATGGDRKTLRKLMPFIRFRFMRMALLNMRKMMRMEGRRPHAIKFWWHGYKLLFGKQGHLRAIAGDYKDFFQPDFHPWQHDNRALISQIENDIFKGTLS